MLPSLHLETTNRCTLACPRCPRTLMLEKFGKKSLPIKDIDLDYLDQFIDISLDNIRFCGTYGDPIYHHNFLDLINLSKNKANKLTIVTNGSFRTQQWWKSILENLTSNDEIIFSIDGVPENFNEYRINGNWQSILIGINECVKSSVQVTWKYIPFSFNEQNINEAEKLAKELGIDNFKINFSDRWDKDDWLKPKNQDLLGNRSSLRDEFKYQEKRNLNVDPKCKTHQEHYVNAEGYYMPCCYMSDYRFYYKSEWWKNKNEYSIQNTKLSEQIEKFNIFYKKINIDKPNYCVFNCGKC